ncbi:MAG: hypothetical protein FJ189_12570, partial [Gammaproteobacteria bacterium]|nr:hypothetical protein [Gammaproteobacteria bacterium]
MSAAGKHRPALASAPAESPRADSDATTRQAASAPNAPSAHDHDDCIHRALASAERLCAERGVRFTPVRRRVLELIWRSHEAVKAYDLLEQLKTFDPAAKPTTVYRALDFLREQGLIHRVESLNAFIGCSDVGHQHEL